MATDYWNQSIFTRKKHHGQIMTVQISREIHSKTMAIIQRTLRYYRRRGQPHPQPKGDLHQGNRHRENGTHHDDHLLWTCAGRLF